MKLVALQGSPRPEGNTQAVLEFVIDAATRSGAYTEVIQLATLKNLTGCQECQACQAVLDAPGCAVHDAMLPVLEKVLSANVIVFAMPVFCWSPSWLIKIAMDRLYCTFKFEDSAVRSLLEGRRMAAVITAGGGEDDGADLVVETCRRLAEFSKSLWYGAFVAGNVKDPAGIRADETLIKRARAFGRQLVA
jgi:multimeric flavodoxin WrbA